MTKWELKNAYDDLLGAGSVEVDEIPENTPGAYGFATSPSVGPAEVQRFETLSQQGAGHALNSGQLPGLPACEPSSRGEAACVTELLTHWGRRAFRRRLTDTELAAYSGLFTTLRTGEGQLSYGEALAAVVEAVLQSPQFHYRRELGDAQPTLEGARIKLSPNEIASRLAFTLWSSPPDDQLLDAAAAGALQGSEDVETQARRLLADARFERTLMNFHRQWLRIEKLAELSKDSNRYPTFTPELAASMAAESDAFVQRALADDGHFQTLLTAPFSFVDSGLASVYGISSGTGAAPQRVELSRDRPGILTRSGFLALHASQGETSPVKRGKVLLEALLCRVVPPPPSNVNVVPPAPDPSKQTREQFEEHSVNAACAGCHKTMDPLGFAFEEFDAIGQVRSMEAGRPVNTTGQIELDGKPLAFADAAELIAALSTSDEVRTCYVRQWMRFFLGREDGDAEQAAVSSVFADFGGKGFDVRELLVSMVKSDAFRYRAPSPGEALP